MSAPAAPEGPPASGARSGVGPPLLFLHAGAGSHLQWLTYFHRFDREYTCLAPDLFGHGSAVTPPGSRVADVVPGQVRALADLLAPLGQPAHVVGHSYGATMGLMLALSHRDLVASLLLVEPPLFRLLSCVDADRPLLDEALGLEGACAADVEAGRLLEASERFVNYWSGPELWPALPDVFRMELAATAAERHRLGSAAMLALALPEDAAERLDGLPVTVVSGTIGPAPARRIAQRLAERLPQAHPVVIEGAGHMLPSTHPRAFLRCAREHLGRARPGALAGATG